MKAKSFQILIISCALALAASATAAESRELPMPVRTVKPEYPADLRAQKVSGLVMVKCTVDEQGNVTEATVSKSSNGGFEQPAVDALKKWKFKPASEKGQPVAISVTIPVKFTADEAS